MPARLGIADIEESTQPLAPSGGSSAPRAGVPTLTLRFRLVPTDDRSLEALRFARRAMLREESTLGVEEGEPSLGEALFSAHEVVWSVPEGCRERCRAKLERLLARANRALSEPSMSPRAGAGPGA